MSIELRKSEVVQNQCDLVMMLCKQVNAFFPILCGEHLVAFPFENRIEHVSQHLLIFYDQDRFRSSHGLDVLHDDRFDSLDFTRLNRKKDAKDRASTRFTLDADEAMMALNNAVRRSKPQPGPFPQFFRCEERFEDPLAG